MAERFVGKWGLVNSENFDEYMKTIGVGLLLRKTGGSLKSTQDISINGDTITIKTSSTFKTTEVKFKLGEDFDETTVDGRKMKMTYTMEGDDLVAKQVPVKTGDLPSTFVRRITPEGMTMTMQAKDVVCTRYFKRE